MSAKKHRQAGIIEVKPGQFVVQVQLKGRRATARVKGSERDAEEARARLLVQLRGPSQESLDVTYQGTTGARMSPAASPARSSSSHAPTLAEWLTGRYSDWQMTTQVESTRRKTESQKRYLIASDLGPMRLDAIGTAEINHYVEWRQKVGALTFAMRKDGQRYRARVSACSSLTINRTVRILSAALRLALDEEVIAKLPKFNLLPEDDARPVMPPTDEQYRALVTTGEVFRAEAPHLPELIEILGEFGLRPGEVFHLTWGSVDWDLGAGDNRGAIRIEEQRRTRVVGGQRWVPKNKRYRVIPFTARGRELLLGLKERAPTAAPDDLVIPNDGGLPYLRLDLGPKKGGGTGIWQRLREAAGVEGVAMRDLRHYFAVQNLVRGVPMSVVSAWMGHSSIELTVKRYGRWAAEAREQWSWAALRSKSVEQVIGRHGAFGPTGQ